MLESNRTASGWADFLQSAHALGLRRIHSSSEYDSFPLLCDALAELRAADPDARFRHIVKLAEPSFDDDAFDAARLGAKIDDYRRALGCDLIDDVQWMNRRSLADPARRLDGFRGEIGVIDDAFASLRNRGRVGRWLCFPYTVDFAEIALEMAGVGGLVVYRNRDETAFDDFLDRCRDLDKTCIAIRPFAAGQAIGRDDATPAQVFAEALAHPAIEAGIVSTSNLDHLAELIG